MDSQPPPPPDPDPGSDPTLLSNSFWRGVAGNIFCHGALVIFLGIGLGAFGAHGLQKFATPQAMATFQTGVTYQIYHGFGLLFLGIFQYLQDFNPSLARSNQGVLKIRMFFYLGILFFSFNCYLYALTRVKFFASLVPIGGFSFLVGWLLLAWAAIKGRRTLEKVPIMGKSIPFEINKNKN